MQGDDAEGVGEEIAFAEEAGGGGDVGEVVKMDRCCGKVIFRLGKAGGEGLGQGYELRLWDGDEGCA